VVAVSADAVDDLHYAEDILAGADALNGYCRPTCGYLDALGGVAWDGSALPDDRDARIAAADEACSDECCGCPCSHPDSRLERV
jgi:hypothetical protein